MPDPDQGAQKERSFETGSDEYWKHQSQLNAANTKRTFDDYQDIALASARRSQSHHDDLNSRTVNSLDSLLTLQSKVNEEHFASIHELRKHLANIQTDRQRHADVWAYETAYDLGNPVTTGTGDTVRAAAYTPNRAVDTASAGVGVAAETVAAAIAKQVDATITPVLAALDAMVKTMEATAASLANVLSQVQPKTQ